MRSFACLGLLFAVALAAGCDSDTPLVLSERNVTLQFSAPDAIVDRYDVWDMTAQGEAGDWLWCERVAAPLQNGSANSVPWTYSLRVSVLPVGETEFVPVTSQAALTDGANLAPYDTLKAANPISRPAQFNVNHPRGKCSGNANLVCNPNSTGTYCQNNGAGSCVAVYSCSADANMLCDPNNMGDTCSSQGAGVCTPAGTCSGNPGIVCVPTCGDLGLGSCAVGTVQRTFFLDAATKRRITSASADFSRPAGNLYNDTCGGNTCTSMPASLTLPGLCPTHSLGPARIDDNDPPFALTLNKGDTVMVEARRFSSKPNGITFQEEPRIRASMFLDGLELQPSAFCPTSNSTCNITGQDSNTEIRFFFVSK